MAAEWPVIAGFKSEERPGTTAATPFTWTKTADELLPYCKPGKRTTFTRH